MLDTYGRLELLGHRVLYGHLSEEEIAGVQFIAIDVVDRGEKGVERQYFSTAAVYCIAPMSERETIHATRPLARAIAAASYEPAIDDYPDAYDEEEADGGPL